MSCWQRDGDGGGDGGMARGRAGKESARRESGDEPIRRHSPSLVFQAVEGSSPVAWTIGLCDGLVQFVYSGSDGSAGTATLYVDP